MTRFITLPRACLTLGALVFASQVEAQNVSVSAGPVATSFAVPSGGATVYTAPAAFPTSVFASFYSGFEPTQTSVEPQPMVTNPVDGSVYPLNLTLIPPIVNDQDPVILPGNSTHPNIYNISWNTNLSTPYSIALRQQIISNVTQLISSNTSNACDRCQMSISMMKPLAVQVPWEVPVALVQLCIQYSYTTVASCIGSYIQSSDGGVLAQVLAYADTDYPSVNSQYACYYYFSKSCPLPATPKFDTTKWFAKPKPQNLTGPKASGQTVKVAHLSDFHIDPRYKIGSEANCVGHCCQPDSVGKNASVISMPAPRFGTFSCDTPYDLAGAVISAIPALLGSGSNAPAFSLYTGDLTTHLDDNQLNRALVTYSEDAVFTMLKSALGGGPIYAALGNHDFLANAASAPASVNAGVAQFSWDYDHVAALWQNLGFINGTQAAQARAHYGAYSVVNKMGLKIITFNSEFWYRANYFNYINVTDPDASGMFAWMRDELQAAEDAGQAVWLMAHVLSGWSGTNGLPAGTDLFYQIVERYAPHVIRNIFFGHTHEDQFTIFYQNNATNISAATALTTAWISPSVTPLTNLNSGFRLYEVDTGSWSIQNAYTYYSNVSANLGLDSQSVFGPTFSLEYSTREAYGSNISWPVDAPLNATWFHLLTEQFEINPNLLSRFHTYQSKTSTQNGNCTSSICQSANICYMRSGSTPLGLRCTPGYDSTQSKSK